MEKLLVLDEGGQKVLEREMATESGPLLVVAAADGLKLAASAAKGDDVIGALVRNDDGWLLASAKPGVDVVAGPKRASELPLLVGQRAKLGGYVFAVEGASAQSGRVVIWRLGRSPVTADVVLSGRNVVTYDESKGVVAVNPAIQDCPLCEFYPGVHGVEVVSRSGAHLTVEPGGIFEIGDFRAIVLPHADAAEALKTRNPFAWPSRKARRLLLASVAALAGVLVAALFVNESAASLETFARSRAKVAQKVEPKAHLSGEALNDDRYLFLFTFYRDLPLALRPKENQTVHDLINRVEDLADEGLMPIKTMLEAVLKCQRGIAANRWVLIDDVLKNVPRQLFVVYGADTFYDDVVEVNELVRESLPDIVLHASEYGHEEIGTLYAKIEAALDNLKDNQFRDVETVTAFVAEVKTNISLLKGYVQARNALLGTSQKAPVETADAIAEVTRTLATLESAIDGVEGLEGYVPLLEREKKLLRERIETWTMRVDLLGEVVNLAEVVNVDPAKLAAWRKLARAQQREIDDRVRHLYREYRLKVRNEPARAQEILGEILKASEADARNPFRLWAEREKKKDGKAIELSNSRTIESAAAGSCVPRDRDEGKKEVAK